MGCYASIPLGSIGCCLSVNNDEHVSPAATRDKHLQAFDPPMIYISNPNDNCRVMARYWMWTGLLSVEQIVMRGIFAWMRAATPKNQIFWVCVAMDSRLNLLLVFRLQNCTLWQYHQRLHCKHCFGMEI